MSKPVLEDEGIIWNTATELHLLQVLVNHKPAGINKHFQMVIIQDKLSSLIPGITCQHIWSKLRTMYDLAAVDDREEHIPFTLEKREFSLPRREFSGIMKEVQKEQRDRPAESISTKARTSNSSRNPVSKNTPESSRTKTTSFSESSRLKSSSGSECSPRPKTVSLSEGSKLSSIPQESPAEVAKKLNASKEKEKETLKAVKSNEAVKAATEKSVNKSEDSLKGSAKRPERATRSTPTTTPAKRRKT